MPGAPFADMDMWVAGEINLMVVHYKYGRLTDVPVEEIRLQPGFEWLVTLVCEDFIYKMRI